MQKLTLYCKSFQRDVVRARRLADSLDRYNRDGLPFYISVPLSDVPLFEEHLAGTAAILITDESIIAANPKHDPEKIAALPGGVSQQIIKSEFWRLGLSECYVCLDSDGEFIRDFYESDFIAPDGSPYTVITEGKSLLEFCDRYHYPKFRQNLLRESRDAQALFHREGRVYDFGIPPLVWSAKVWSTLDEQLLKPKGLTLADLLEQYPYELRIYGEALLKFRPVPSWPSESFFKAYHYESQYLHDKKRGINRGLLEKNYLGVVLQSNWEAAHYGKAKKNPLSIWVKSFKRFVRYLSV